MTLGRRTTRWRWLLSATVVALVAVNTLDVPLSVPRMRALAGGQTILDLRLGYGPDDAYRLLDALGAAGRHAYLRMLWTVDLALPALFSGFLWSAVGAGALRRSRCATLLPAVADYLENATITALLLGYPARWNAVARLAGASTVAKHALYMASLAVAIGGAVVERRRTRAREALPPAVHRPTQEIP
ncbi:hypothetical protein [Anaeromyxobacter oryzae]|uniref:Uncharacterized protein n=1 Tax=Anaeromyxobacter oryzae TaxID=2918170 RepID=A0ABM7X0T0_9BACT|nr:hypothetical protein [Anaeromyxobacter oryzae]BDG05310.1 hypothetical protein AMOR_43060 [Anaeromyxobacter oryzae]